MKDDHTLLKRSDLDDVAAPPNITSRDKQTFSKVLAQVKLLEQVGASELIKSLRKQA